jgi:hypothetical protein
MQLYTQDFGRSLVCEVGYWYFSVYLNPAHWALTYHWKKPCCKFHMVVWMFEINRIWTQEETESGEYDAICAKEFD